MVSNDFAYMKAHDPSTAHKVIDLLVLLQNLLKSSVHLIFLRPNDIYIFLKETTNEIHDKFNKTSLCHWYLYE